MAKDPGAKDSKGRYLDPTAAINAGLMKKQSGEVFGPGRAAAKVASEVESFSYRASELTKAQRAKIAAQNAAANSAKSKNLDAVDRGKIAAETAKNNQLAKEEYAHKMGMTKGKIIGGAAGVAAGVAADELVRDAKAKGTQAAHHVTDHTTHTQTVKPSVPLPPEGSKRPAVGNDKSAAKKANGPSWNNGYTN